MSEGVLMTWRRGVWQWEGGVYKKRVENNGLGSSSYLTLRGGGAGCLEDAGKGGIVILASN